MAGVEVTFRVTLQEESCGRTLFIVGNCSELGHWKPKLAKPLQLASKSPDSEVWVGSYSIAAESVLYRFFLGSVQVITKNSATEDIVVVHSWETFAEPRHLKTGETGVDDIQTVYGHWNGSVCVDRGWLTGQTAIRLSLHNDAIRFRGHHGSLSPADRYFIKCLPIDTRVPNGGGIDVLDTNDNHSYARGSTIATEMFVFVLDDKLSSPRLLPPEGVEYKPSDLATFRVETWSPEHLAFKIVVSREDETAPNGKSFKEIGAAFVDPVDLTCSKKFIAASILSRDGEIVGHLKIDVLVIKSLEYECDMSGSVRRFQKPHPDRTWFIGHRGMGRTIKDGVQCAGQGKKENTIASLREAFHHGADFVEFDVMLSKDRIPVLHHDFATSISARAKLKGEERRIVIPVQHLDLKELESLQTLAMPGSSHSENICGKDHERELEEQPFPLLKSCLQKIDPHGGFNVEVKYCQHLRSGELEDGMNHFPCRNDYVDIILAELLRHSRSRKILLSSFDPDVCVMMREKQNRHPVMFLTQGDTKKYPQYADPRTWDVETAIRFAAAESFRGVCVHVEDVLRDPALIGKGKGSGLWVISWGDENNSPENVRFLVKHGMDGIILDGIEKFLGR